MSQPIPIPRRATILSAPTPMPSPMNYFCGIEQDNEISMKLVERSLTRMSLDDCPADLITIKSTFADRHNGRYCIPQK